MSDIVVALIKYGVILYIFWTFKQPLYSFIGQLVEKAPFLKRLQWSQMSLDFEAQTKGGGNTLHEFWLGHDISLLMMMLVSGSHIVPIKQQIKNSLKHSQALGLTETAKELSELDTKLEPVENPLPQDIRMMMFGGVSGIRYRAAEELLLKHGE